MKYLTMLVFLLASATATQAQCGTASWYGPGFNGKKTASGVVFNTSHLTAASKTLPFGTKVKVTNQRNNKAVTVTINDRGPFVRGRIIDLSEAAAKAIGIKATGTGPVCLEILR